MKNLLSRFTFFMATSFVLVSCEEAKETRTAKEKHPNIIYILADDLGYGDISAFNA